MRADEYAEAWEDLDTDRILELHGAGFEDGWLDTRIPEDFVDVVGSVWRYVTGVTTLSFVPPSA